MKLNFALFIITFVFNCPIVKAEDDIRSRHKRSDDGFVKDNSWRNSTDTLVSVRVQLRFVEFHNALENNAIPDVNLTAPNGTTAFEFLSQAAKQNPCYQFQYKKFSFGRNITSICCVSENRTSHYYWYIYMNDEPSLVGVDQLKPRHGDLLQFQYQHINYNSSNHEKKVGKVSKTGLNLTKIQDTTPQISVLVELSFTNHLSPNVIPAHDVKARRNSTAFELLQLAAKFNPCYSFRYEEFSFGRYITTICCTEQNMTSGFYWFVYINGKRSAVGVDSLKPNDADTLTFKYEQWKATHTDPITRSTDNIKKPTTTTLLITTSAGNAWTLSSLVTPNDTDMLTFKHEQLKTTHTDHITRSTDNIKKPTTTTRLITTSAGNAWTLSSLVTPNDTDTLTFKYEQLKTTHITRSTDNIKKPTDTTRLITTSAGNAWTLSSLMINVFIVSASVFFYDYNNLL